MMTSQYAICSFAEKSSDATAQLSHESDKPHTAVIHDNVEPSTINPASFLSNPSPLPLNQHQQFLLYETLQTSFVPNETTSQPINNARHKLMAKKKKKKKDKKRVRKEKKTVTYMITPGNSINVPGPMLDNESGTRLFKQLPVMDLALPTQNPNPRGQSGSSLLDLSSNKVVLCFKL
ncbi:unnamed protein product [Ambrosiozyma monospora]|uniref:Unnamed protein product n=1 Tax=Ambrosiozyma monospora TaxID=43982 RepID=A0A9W6YUM5_AMBMO|nr:unnamed protein product [Ambrosiozyma monospora]